MTTSTDDLKLDQVCFRTRHLDEPWTFESYRSVGGYDVLEKILKEKKHFEDIYKNQKYDFSESIYADFPDFIYISI